MSEIITVGLDLAKNVFQAHGADASGQAVLRKKLRRDQVLVFFSQLRRMAHSLDGHLGSATGSEWQSNDPRRIRLPSA